MDSKTVEIRCLTLGRLESEHILYKELECPFKSSVSFCLHVVYRLLTKKGKHWNYVKPLNSSLLPLLKLQAESNYLLTYVRGVVMMFGILVEVKSGVRMPEVVIHQCLASTPYTRYSEL